MSASPVQLDRGHWVLLLLVLVLMASNLAFYGLLETEKRAHELALVEFQKVPDMMRSRTEALARDIQTKAARTFQDMLSSMNLSNRLTEESHAKVGRLMEAREAQLAQIKEEAAPSQKMAKAFEALDLDRDIIKELDDMNRLQQMHRNHLMTTLKPLASELGLQEQN